MNPNLFSIPIRDLQVNQIFYIKESAEEFTTLELIEPIINKGNILELNCIDKTTGNKRLLILNQSFPIDIFVDKLNTDWRII